MVSLALPVALARSVDGSIFLSAISGEMPLGCGLRVGQRHFADLAQRQSAVLVADLELDEIDAGPPVAKPDAKSGHAVVDLLVIGLAGRRLEAADAGLGEFHDWLVPFADGTTMGRSKMSFRVPSRPADQGVLRTKVNNSNGSVYPCLSPSSRVRTVVADL